MHPKRAWETFRHRSFRQHVVWLLRPVHMRWTLALGLLAAVTGWVGFLVPSAVYYIARLFNWVVEKLLWSVRAKLGAFYLHAAVVPLLLFLTILLLLGYLVLWNISARVVEGRLLDLATWSEQGCRSAEETWWRVRATGGSPSEAADAAVQAGWGATHDSLLAVWVRRVDRDQMLAVVGEPARYEPLRAPWLGNERFAGLTTSGSHHNLTLRTSLVVDDATGPIEIGSAWELGADVLNRGLAASSTDLHGDVGGPHRSLHWVAQRSDSAVVASGILALYEPVQDDTTAAATTAAHLQDLRDRIASRFPVLLGHYQGHPVDWRSGRTTDGGPPVLIAFSIEAGVGALLSTSYEAETVVVWAALSVMVLLLFVFLFATVRGLLYARSIAASVSKLDQGVRAIQKGDFGFRIEPRERDQLGELAKGFNGMASQLQGLLEEQAAHRVVERELEIARSVQARLFPQANPRSDSLEAVGICLPARTVSGDYYDFVPIRGGWDLVVADVSGKGMSAALLMASLQASFRAQYGSAQEAPPDPALVLDHVNRHLGTTAEPTRFVTLFLVRYDGSGKLVYCNAGHNPGVHVQQGKAHWMKEGGLMLGPFPDRPYTGHVRRVAAGDLLCLYSDGVTEAMDPHGELFGEERLATLLQQNADQPLADLRNLLVQRVRDWRQGGAATDDVTFVLLRILQPTG